MSYKPDNDYIEVAERMELFYERYPQGRIVCNEAPVGFRFMDGEREYIAVHAKAYRNPDDQHPGDGWAWEPVPGTTPFTKNSELMNAQTAAIGRAIVSVGLLASRKIASAEEVRNRKEEQAAPEEKPKPKAKAKSGISDEMVKQLEPAVKSWLKDHDDKREDFKVKLVALGVLEPEKPLKEVLSQLPDEAAATKLSEWLNANDGQ